MAQEIAVLDRTRSAHSDLSAKQFYAVVLQTDGSVDIQSTNYGPVYGILQNKPASGVAATVRCMGVTKAVAGGTVTAGDLLTVDNGNGKVITAASTGRYVIGWALDGGASGNTITVVLLPLGKN